VPVVHVKAECSVEADGHTTYLRRIGSPTRETAPPIAWGPDILARGAASPRFEIDPGDNPFFAVELTTDVSLFAPAQSALRTADNFYATWQDRSLLSGSVFQADDGRWENLSARANALFYRIITSARRDTWTESQASSPAGDMDRTPFVAFADGRIPPPDPLRLMLSRVCRRLDMSIPGAPAMVEVRFREQTSVPFRELIVLPEVQVLAIDEVF
jgi:hypothetical protein